MNGYKKLFDNEVQNYLYPFFWQHGEKHEILGEYIDKISESGMKAMCIEARPHPDFVGDKWWSDMDFIIKNIKEKDMKIWILDDSHFPTGYANGKIKSDYPHYLKQYLNCRRYDIQGPINEARIDLKILKGRVWDKPESDIEIIGVYMAKRSVDYEDIDATTIVDITHQMNMSNRLLKVDVPKGAYSIFTVYKTFKGEEEATKDYLNPLVKEATQVLINEVYVPHYNHYKEEFGKSIQGFFSDEPRFGNVKGTEAKIGDDMPLPYRDGLENELSFENKYLVLLWCKANGDEAKVRVDYMNLITKLYNENFTKVLADWCEKHHVMYLGHTIEDNGVHARLGYGTGHYFRGQEAMHIAGIDVIGTQVVPGMNYHHDAFNTGGANGEFYHYALAKLGSSAAHLDPKKQGRIMCEAFGAYGWNEGLKLMKWIADHLMVRGVNYIVPHAFNPKEFPDWDCPPHFYAAGYNPQFRYFRVLDDYMNRVMSIFRDGHYPSKISVYYPAELEWAGEYQPIEKVSKQLIRNQIAFDIVSTDYLENAKVTKGSFMINQTEFEVLVVPYGKYINNQFAEVIVNMLENDIKVIFMETLPNRVLGHFDEIKWQKIKEKTEVIPTEKLGKELKSYQNIEFENCDQDLVVGEYSRDDKRVYMIFNESTCQTADTSFSFKEEGYVYLYNAFEDTLIEVNKLHLKLTPYESCIYVISKEKLDAEKADKKTYTEEVLDSKWDVYYCDSKSYPNFETKLPLDSLNYAHNLEGYEDKVGTLRYNSNIKLSKVNTLLDLGEVYETAEVFVNNKSCGVKLCKPYIFDISEYLIDGNNEVSIEVTNTLGTSIREGFSHYLPIEPFGLEGNVRLFLEKK